MSMSAPSRQKIDVRDLEIEAIAVALAQPLRAASSLLGADSLALFGVEDEEEEEEDDEDWDDEDDDEEWDDEDEDDDEDDDDEDDLGWDDEDEDDVEEDEE